MPRKIVAERFSFDPSWHRGREMVGDDVQSVYTGKAMPRTNLKHKHVKLDQRKIDFAKRYFGAASEQEAIDRALSLLMEEQQVVKRLRPLAGILRGDERPWPYR